MADHSKATTAADPQGKTLTLFFDGTADKFGASNSNVIKLQQLLDKDATTQKIYYQPGVGTYTLPSLITPITAKLAKLADEAVAWYISQHILGGYEYLCDNYKPGDKICLFGFSRGAYTARALAGMLEKIGLLPAGNPEQLKMAWDLYKATDKDTVRLARVFKRTFSKDVVVDFVGVWDTVSAVGAIRSRHFPYAARSQSIKAFRQVIALDEHRVKFRQNRFQTTPMSQADAKLPELRGYLPDEDLDPHANLHESIGDHTADVQEIYMAGCHSTIGGGDLPDVMQHQLSNISLHWMIRKIQQHGGTGIVFHDGRLADFFAAFDAQVRVDSKDLRYNGNIEGPIIDSLANYSSFGKALKTFGWQLLELFPFPRNTWDSKKNKWTKNYSPHLGKSRSVAAGSAIHESVRDMQRVTGYKTRAIIEGEPRFVSTDDIGGGIMTLKQRQTAPW